MRLITVDDPADPRLADYVALTDTRLRRVVEPAEGLFIAEGEAVIRRAVAGGYRMRSVLLTSRWLPGLADLLESFDGAVLVGEEALLESVTGFAVHRGALASMHRRPLPRPEELLGRASRVAVLESIVNPTNVGAIFRAAAALGVDAILLDPLCCDPLYRRSVKVSMGAVFAIPYARLDAWPSGLDVVHAAGLTVLALTPAPGAVPIDALDEADTVRCALLLGTEGEGLSRAALDAADRWVRIPMSGGVDSLNVGAAAAVAFWAVRPTSGPR